MKAKTDLIISSPCKMSFLETMNSIYANE